MAAAGAGTGPSPDAALGGQEVTQGHGGTGGFSTARGMSRAPAAAAAGAGPHNTRSCRNRDLLIGGHREGGQRRLRGPRSAGPVSARHARANPGAPLALELQESPGGCAPLGSAAGLGRGGLLCPRRAKNTEAAGRQRAPGGTVRSGARAAAWEAMATSRPRHTAVTAAPTAGVAHVGLPAARARCARGTERGRRRLPPVTEGK